MRVQPALEPERFEPGGIELVGLSKTPKSSAMPSLWM
jgi:hypothetical protein